MISLWSLPTFKWSIRSVRGPFERCSERAKAGLISSGIWLDPTRTLPQASFRPFKSGGVDNLVFVEIQCDRTWAVVYSLQPLDDGNSVRMKILSSHPKVINPKSISRRKLSYSARGFLSPKAGRRKHKSQPKLGLNIQVSITVVYKSKTFDALVDMTATTKVSLPDTKNKRSAYEVNGCTMTRTCGNTTATWLIGIKNRPSTTRFQFLAMLTIIRRSIFTGVQSIQDPSISLLQSEPCPRLQARARDPISP